MYTREGLGTQDILGSDAAFGADGFSLQYVSRRRLGKQFESAFRQLTDRDIQQIIVVH